MPRLLIWQRPMLRFDRSLEQLRTLIHNGYVVVSEYDDDPAHWPDIAAHRHLTFSGVHAVQVSTEPLAEVIRPHNSELAVFGNAVESLPSLPPPETGEQLGGRPLRLFFGALHREADWAPWMDTLNELFAANPGGWEVEVVHDRGFYKALRLPGRRYTPTCDYATYRGVMGSCDIAFLPLRDTPFNCMKSDLKAVEAAAHGLAVLASPTVYADSLEQGRSGCLFNSSGELRRVLLRWRDDPLEMRTIAARGREWVAACRLQCHQTAARQAWYRSLWERRVVLTERLLERVPDLRG
jgi:hypothetical protein